MADIDPQAVVDFWFTQLKPQDWFKRSDAVDQDIASRFAALHASAAAGELWLWRSTATGRLAEIIVLDQFSRNLFREDARAFAQDSMALVLAQEAVANQIDTRLTLPQRQFLYMPYMHSESLAVHEEAVRLFSVPGLEFNLDFELRHQEIIARFGRYPHRNTMLGRTSTAAETQFLSQPGSGF